MHVDELPMVGGDRETDAGTIIKSPNQGSHTTMTSI